MTAEDQKELDRLLGFIRNEKDPIKFAELLRTLQAFLDRTNIGKAPENSAKQS